MKSQSVVSGINPKTKKKESFYFTDKNTTNNWDRGQLKVKELKKKGYTKVQHMFPTLLGDIFNIGI
jgi:hypothetical protein